MTPYFSFVLTERPLFFSLFSLLPKDPYFEGLVSLPYVSAPPKNSMGLRPDEWVTF